MLTTSKSSTTIEKTYEPVTFSSSPRRNPPGRIHATARDHAVSSCKRNECSGSAHQRNRAGPAQYHRRHGVKVGEVFWHIGDVLAQPPVTLRSRCAEAKIGCWPRGSPSVCTSPKIYPAGFACCSGADRIFESWSCAFQLQTQGEISTSFDEQLQQHRRQHARDGDRPVLCAPDRQPAAGSDGGRRVHGFTHGRLHRRESHGQLVQGAKGDTSAPAGSVDSDAAAITVTPRLARHRAVRH